MTLASLGVFLVILQACSLIPAVTVVQHPDEEYIVDHEISYKKAIEEAKKLTIYPGPIPGCKTCTANEMTYCSDGGVVNDHCCCDNGQDDEVFKFVAHVCLIGPEACQVQAGDCAEYTRLRECCCHAYHAEKWKNKANESMRSRDFAYFNFILILSAAALVKLFLK